MDRGQVEIAYEGGDQFDEAEDEGEDTGEDHVGGCSRRQSCQVILTGGLAFDRTG